MQAQKAEGTRDLIGAEMRAWQKMQQIAAGVFEPFGFKPIETPAIEQVDVFVHGIGQSTDVVRKEMFRVFSGANLERVFTEGTDTKLKPKQRLALRPEGTAGVVRAVVENNLVPQGSTPFKAYYAEAMFRGERPQKGRLRQFHQVGIEWLGAPDPAADAECIIMLMEFYKRLGFDLSKLRLLINSMGDAQCRPAYREQVKQFILDHADEMCDECRERAELNPLRAFDCKNDHCREIMAEAPLMGDNLCDECREHYEQVKRYLDAAGIEYVEDPTLVRGLDYYTRTVFEVEAPGAGVGSIGGGGRYDGLVELEGGKPTAGVGFAVGFERALLALQAFGSDLGADEAPCVYVANAGKELRQNVFTITQQLRAAGIVTEADYQGRSLKAQFKQADKVGAKLILVLGGDELAAAQVSLVENIQRRDLSAVEEALAFRDLIERFGLTQDEVADKVGKSRPAVTNSLRLLELPDAVLEMISDGRLSMGHARAILGLNDKSDEARTALAEKVAAADLSVRETEQLVKSLNAPKKEKKPQPERDEQTAAYYAELERKTMKILGRRVRISDGGEGKRRLELDYETSEDLEELLTKLCGSELFSE